VDVSSARRKLLELLPESRAGEKGRPLRKGNNVCSVRLVFSRPPDRRAYRLKVGLKWAVVGGKKGRFGRNRGNPRYLIELGPCPSKQPGTVSQADGKAAKTQTLGGGGTRNRGTQHVPPPLNRGLQGEEMEKHEEVCVCLRPGAVTLTCLKTKEPAKDWVTVVGEGFGKDA